MRLEKRVILGELSLYHPRLASNNHLSWLSALPVTSSPQARGQEEAPTTGRTCSRDKADPQNSQAITTIGEVESLTSTQDTELCSLSWRVM